MKKIFLKLFITTIASLTLLGCSVSSLTIVDKNEFSYMSTQLNLNTNFMKNIFKNTKIDDLNTNSTINLWISNDKKHVDILLRYNSIEYPISLIGDVSKNVSNGNVEGFVGIYQGVMNPFNSIDLQLDENEKLPVVADIIFNQNNAFVAITFGYETTNKQSITLVFGCLDDELKKISATNYYKNIEVDNLKAEYNNSSYNTNSVNAKRVFKGKQEIYYSTYQIGMISVFQSEQVRNGANVYSEVKVNTNTDNFRQFLLNVKGVDNLQSLIIADQFVVSTRANNIDVVAVEGTNCPAAGSKSLTIDLPYYAPVIGFGTIPVTIKYSSVNISFAPYTNVGRSKNEIKWTMTKSNGWNYKSLDGDQSTKTGLVTEVYFSFEDNVTVETNCSFLTRVSIRYLYYVSENGIDMVALHMTTPYTPITTYVKVEP